MSSPSSDLEHGFFVGGACGVSMTGGYPVGISKHFVIGSHSGVAIYEIGDRSLLAWSTYEGDGISKTFLCALMLLFLSGFGSISCSFTGIVLAGQ